MMTAPIGSDTFANTTGMEEVSRWSAATAPDVCAKITSGFAATSSLASGTNRSGLPLKRKSSCIAAGGPAELFEALLQGVAPRRLLRIAFGKREQRANAAHRLLPGKIGNFRGRHESAPCLGVENG